MKAAKPARLPAIPVPRVPDLSRRGATATALTARMETSRRRLGAGPFQRLAWLLRFITTDLGALHREEHVALGYDLRAFAVDDSGALAAVDAPPMSDER